ncbi:MAG: hypothetical protein HQ592_06400 [Planctomycetes bacterium]|nr:hypothetical protein [Planctomycetota bacterium]
MTLRTTHTLTAVSGLILAVLHASPAPAGEAAKPKPPASLKGRSCSEAGCHDALKKNKFVHGPVAADMCSSCHTVSNEARHKFGLARESEKLCSGCHIGVVSQKVKHFPAEAGECAACHNPHSANNEMLLLNEEPGELCITCHDDVPTAGGKKHVHAPVGLKLCTACHEAHDSDHAKLLKGTERETCTLCHDEIIDDSKTYKSVHKPVEQGCLTCHKGHGSDAPKLLVAARPDLCYKCHEDKKMVGDDKVNSHAAALRDHGCEQCHQPHVSDVVGLGRKPQVEQCLGCHTGSKMFDGRTIPDIRRTVVRPKFKHAPVQEGTCTGCHDVHGPHKPQLLSKRYSPDFYKPFKLEEYALCFGCHNNALVLEAKTETATNFRNGSRNLHFLHVNKKRKGRACHACHASHATDAPKLVRATARFGEWDMPIGFSGTKNGGNCDSGCHLPKRYDRLEAVNYSARAVSPPRGKGAPEEEEAEKAP